MAQKRANSPARSAASTQCRDILCPRPGASEVISHRERLSSNEMKMAPICVWIAAGFSCGSSDIGCLQSEWVCNLSLPHGRPLSTPMESSSQELLAMTGGGQPTTVSGGIVQEAVARMLLQLFGLDFLAVQPTLVGVPRFVAIGEDHVLPDLFFLDFGIGADSRMLPLRSRPKMLLARVRHIESPFLFSLT